MFNLFTEDLFTMTALTKTAVTAVAESGMIRFFLSVDTNIPPPVSKI